MDLGSYDFAYESVTASSGSVSHPVLIAAPSNEDASCWKLAEGRGAGQPLHTCAEGLEKSGALCYPPC